MSYYENVRGTVKSFDEEKGYGFITPDIGGPDFGGQDLVVHYKVIDREGFKTLRPGERVIFHVQKLASGVWRIEWCGMLEA
ncbi:cold shock domain-containing protein [Pseudomonas sp. App30]|uniref:cold-shock protein n=1 Tax=Pseudomonas sp. App30 TaxID=3068990 RepID=UPI003A7F978D